MTIEKRYNKNQNPIGHFWFIFSYSDYGKTVAHSYSTMEKWVTKQETKNFYSSELNVFCY